MEKKILKCSQQPQQEYNEEGATAKAQDVGGQHAAPQASRKDPEDLPTILFDLNGVLIEAKRGSNPAHDPVHVPGKFYPFVPRPGLEHLLSLRPFFRLGIYTSASWSTARRRLESIHQHLASDHAVQHYIWTENIHWNQSKPQHKSLFPILLTRNDCTPDTEWQQREDGKPHDTVKPIAAHGFDLSRTVLVDDSLRKVLPDEMANSLQLPTLLRVTDVLHVPEPSSGVACTPEGSCHVPLMRALCRLLLHHLAGCQGDIRAGVQLVRQEFAQALKSRDGVTPLPECLQHLRSSPSEPADLELPLLFERPNPLGRPSDHSPPPADRHNGYSRAEDTSSHRRSDLDMRDRHARDHEGSRRERERQSTERERHRDRLDYIHGGLHASERNSRDHRHHDDRDRERLRGSDGYRGQGHHGNYNRHSLVEAGSSREQNRCRWRDWPQRRM